jgi:F0F1-type ATP synthase gamma subunit
MNFYLPESAPSTYEHIAETPEELAQRLQGQITYIGEHLESWKKRFDRIKETLQEFAEEGDIEEGTTLNDYLIEEFDLEMTKEVEVRITVTYSAIMTIPKDDDASDYASDLEIQDVEMNHDKAELTSVSCDNYEIEEL